MEDMLPVIRLNCTKLYCTILYCTVLYCTILYCTVDRLAMGQKRYRGLFMDGTQGNIDPFDLRSIGQFTSILYLDSYYKWHGELFLLSPHSSEAESESQDVCLSVCL